MSLERRPGFRRSRRSSLDEAQDPQLPPSEARPKHALLEDCPYSTLQHAPVL